MSDCGQVKTLLGRYHDSELPPADRVLVERHLLSCPLCSRELKDIHTLSMAFQRVLVVPPVPEALASRIMAQARERAGGTLPAWAPFRFWKNWSLAMRFAAVAVSAAACYVGLVIGSASLSSKPAGDEMRWIAMTSRGPIVTAYVGATR